MRRRVAHTDAPFELLRSHGQPRRVFFVTELVFLLRLLFLCLHLPSLDLPAIECRTHVSSLKPKPGKHTKRTVCFRSWQASFSSTPTPRARTTPYVVLDELLHQSRVAIVPSLELSISSWQESTMPMNLPPCLYWRTRQHLLLCRAVLWSFHRVVRATASALRPRW